MVCELNYLVIFLVVYLHREMKMKCYTEMTHFPSAMVQEKHDCWLNVYVKD